MPYAELWPTQINISQAMRTLTERLKEETRNLHDETEKKFRSDTIFSGEFTKENYEQLISVNHKFFSSFESAVHHKILELSSELNWFLGSIMTVSPETECMYESMRGDNMLNQAAEQALPRRIHHTFLPQYRVRATLQLEAVA